jgi:hypothetical protein
MDAYHDLYPPAVPPADAGSMVVRCARRTFIMEVTRTALKLKGLPFAAIGDAIILYEDCARAIR